jgi:capsule polysaccharide export protein KpsE/RkpR
MLNEDTKSGVISITVTDHDRYRAAEIAGAYVQELNRVSVQNNNTSAHLQRIFVEKRLGEVNQDLKVSSAKLAQFSSKNMTIDTATQGKAMMEAGSDLEGKLISTEAQLSGLRKYYTDDNPRVSSLLATVSELQKQLNRMRTGKETGGTSGEIYPSLRELPLLSETYEDLFRHVRIEATVADLLTRQFEAAKVEEAKELPVVQMLDSPNVAEKHSSPKRGLVIVGSFFFYISLGVLLIFLEGYWKGLDSSDKKKMLFAELAGYGRSLLHG